MRILLTGGAGYVGSACLRWLLRRGHDALAYDNLFEGNAAAVPEDRLIVADIQDRNRLVEVLGEHRVEAVMHFAAAASVPESIIKPEFYYRTNVIGTKNVLDAMRECGVDQCGVDRIVFSSTAATYSFNAQMPLGEDSPQVPEVPYGTTKLAAERMIEDYCRAYGMGCAILRYFNASGADPDGRYGECRGIEGHLIPLVLHTALGLREKVLIFGGDWDTRDGTCVRDYVHTDDLAQAHQLAIEHLQPGEEMVYNVGAGEGSTVMEVLRACEQVVGRPIPHEIVDRRAGDPGVLVSSPQKIKRELGWKPQYPDVRDIVATAWRWHQSRPDGYKSTVAQATVRADPATQSPEPHRQPS